LTTRRITPIYGINFAFYLLAGGIVLLLALCLGLALLWVILNLFRERREYRLIIRRHEEAERTRKSGIHAEGVIWDREMDG
jgi:hypothetical protein